MVDRTGEEERQRRNQEALLISASGKAMPLSSNTKKGSAAERRRRLWKGPTPRDPLLAVKQILRAKVRAKEREKLGRITRLLTDPMLVLLAQVHQLPLLGAGA